MNIYFVVSSLAGKFSFLSFHFSYFFVFCFPGEKTSPINIFKKHADVFSVKQQKTHGNKERNDCKETKK